jgi:carbon-monoxide dehydrogenase medium subunit
MGARRQGSEYQGGVGELESAAVLPTRKPRSLEEALDLLERPGAKVLAGGQSLIPSLNMRLSSPELLVDVGAIASLGGVRVSADSCASAR